MLGSVNAEGAATDACLTAIDALRAMARHQCARDLFEKFLCAKVVPLQDDERWFSVSDERYKDKVLKCCGCCLGEGAEIKAKSHEAGLARVLKTVSVAAEEIVGSLGSVEIRSIRSALSDRWRLNRVFDLLRVTYSDWPYPSSDAGAGKAGALKKRKQAEVADEKTSRGGKRGERGRGHEDGREEDSGIEG